MNEELLKFMQHILEATDASLSANDRKEARNKAQKIFKSIKAAVKGRRKAKENSELEA